MILLWRKSLLRRRKSKRSRLRRNGTEMPLSTQRSSKRRMLTPVSRPYFLFRPRKLTLVALGGLDQFLDPLLSNFTTAIEQKVLAAPRERHVDWREGKAKPLNTPAQRRSAYIQQAGITAPDGFNCVHCGNLKGPFFHCRVLIVGGEPHFGGSCGNCSFNSGSNACSLRTDGQDGGLAAWVKTALAA